VEEDPEEGDVTRVVLNVTAFDVANGADAGTGVAAGGEVGRAPKDGALVLNEADEEADPKGSRPPMPRWFWMPACIDSIMGRSIAPPGVENTIRGRSTMWLGMPRPVYKKVVDMTKIICRK
jgi:hypothetical protein